jgi:hypothetical protein
MQNAIPVYNNRAALKVAMKDIDLWDTELEFGRFELGTLNFAGRTHKGDLINVCVGIKSMADIADLDVSLEETIDTFMHHTFLSVELIKNNQETVLLYDSFVDKDALAARTKDMAAYAQLASQEHIDSVRADNFATCIHEDLTKKVSVNLLITLNEDGAVASVSLSDKSSAFDIEINEQTRALDLSRFTIEAFKEMGYMEEREKAINILLATLEYITSHK